MKRNNNGRSFYGKIFALSALLIVTIAVAAMGIIYYWSFYHYNRIFEDRVIDEQTLKYAQSLGVENEWLLGVNTHSIDILEATYNKKVSDHIHEKALTQEDITQYYREKIDGKDLIYCISMDYKDGEYFYKYSVVRDLYHEVFPSIILTMVGFLMVVMLILYFYVRFIDKQFSKGLDELNAYAQKLEKLDLGIEPIQLNNPNPIINALAETFRKMHIQLSEKERLQKSSLQYISHEMKSPIMIIESYVVSAKDGIFPNGTLEASYDTILEQTDRMKDKVSSLLKYVTLSTMEPKKETFDLTDCIYTILTNYQAQIRSAGSFIYHIQEGLEIFADPDKIQIALQNLLENQLKYRQSQMCIRAYQKEETAIILFYNDGMPISSELKAQIFTPFTKGYNGSNGLGLSITKTILLQHGGTIELLKTRRGTLFQVKIPTDSK